MDIQEALFLVEERSQPGNPFYYKPFDPVTSRLLREHYRSNLKFLEHGNIFFDVKNRVGTLISRGYIRVVIGDYGVFLELSPAMVCQDHLTSRFSNVPGFNNSGNKYNWLETKDSVRTKVYHQVGTVKYADYKVGLYYVSPSDVFPVDTCGR